MSLLRFLALASSAFVCVLACGKSTDTVDGAKTDGGSEADTMYTFRPQDAARACATDADCVVVQAITSCGTCCGQAAVSREGEKAFTAVRDACGKPGAPTSFNCEMGCGMPRPSCFDGTCVTLQDGLPGSDSCGTDAGGTPTTEPPGEPGPGPACGAAPVQTGFEDGLDPSWNVTEPSAFQIDRASPINGAASLRVSYRQQPAFFTITQPEACGVRIAFTMRTKLVASGLDLVRVVAGDGTWFHVRLEGCALSVSEETNDGVAAGMSYGGVSWPIPQETAVRVVLTFDLRGKTMTSTAAPIGAPLPAAKPTGIRSSPSGIRAIELGSPKGIVSTAIGNVWLDDLTID